MANPRTDQSSLPFLNFFSEVRNIVHGFALASSPLRMPSFTVVKSDEVKGAWLLVVQNHSQVGAKGVSSNSFKPSQTI